MAILKVLVGITANFEANLASIEAFWLEIGAPAACNALLDDLAESVIPNLEKHPRIGRPFLDREAGSVETRARIAALTKNLGDDELREYLSGDYLILYAISGNVVNLLSIRHHRQLSFDFARLWQR